MEERLKSVIEKIILPHFPSIIRYNVSVEGNREMKYNFVFDRPIYKNLTTYIVELYFDSDQSMKKFGSDAIEQTINLFEMLGPEDNENIRVNPHSFRFPLNYN